ncbi:MAG: hypothetical protein ACJA1L_000452 [Paracoccaceae bacterium]|jgi:hypothetical protein
MKTSDPADTTTDTTIDTATGATTPLQTSARSMTIEMGVVLRRRLGVTRWAKWGWDVIAVLPGAGPADWKVMRQDGDVTEYHAATVPMTLYRTDAEAYRVSITMAPPSVFVVLRKTEGPDAPHDVMVYAVTASAYEAQDYLDSGEEIVEPVALPEGLTALIRDFIEAHFDDTPFVKRRRDKQRVDRSEAGIGDPRIRQTADVYRAPGAAKPGTEGEA